MYLVYSGTSDNGHFESGQPPYNGQLFTPALTFLYTSEEGTTSEQWTNARPQHVHYSEVPLCRDGHGTYASMMYEGKEFM